EVDAGEGQEAGGVHARVLELAPDDVGELGADGRRQPLLPPAALVAHLSGSQCVHSSCESASPSPYCTMSFSSSTILASASESMKFTILATISCTKVFSLATTAKPSTASCQLSWLPTSAIATLNLRRVRSLMLRSTMRFSFSEWLSGASRVRRQTPTIT